jgi:Domain of unknown function (DUF1835)
MKNILNITNGDSTVDLMKKAGIPGIFLPWRDVLHDGPVPRDLTLDELSKVRAKFIACQGWGEINDVEGDFIDRDDTLKSLNVYDEIILWFEHDLYDQLQMLQILDWLHKNNTSQVTMSLICTDNYLGMLLPDELPDLLRYKHPITKEQLLLSSKAWAAFRESSPESWSHLLNSDTSVLPFLEGAIVRMLEEYPSCFNGLSRTAQQALKIISKGENRAGKIFALNQELEERMYLGDSSFWCILQELLDSNPALLKLSEGRELVFPAVKKQQLTITQTGLDVLSGKYNWLEIKNQNRWIGGVHLQPNNNWCWNSSSGSIKKRNLC